MAGITQILKQADVFYLFTPTQLELVASLCEERAFNRGEVIFLEGTNSSELCIIAQGEVEILVTPRLFSAPADGPNEKNWETQVVIATLRRGQSFGEIALVDMGLRSATARASQNKSRLLVIPRDRLLQLCEAYPQLGYRLMRNLAADLAQKIRSTDLFIREGLLYGRRGLAK